MGLGNLVKCFKKPHNGGNNTTGGNTVIIQKGDENNYNSDSLYVKDITAERGTIKNLKTVNLESDNIKTGFIQSESVISKSLKTDSLGSKVGSIDTLNSYETETNKLTVKETADIYNIINSFITSKKITADYLTVNKAAHFFEIIIDKINSVGGTIINTAANTKADYIEAYNSLNEKISIDSPNIAYFRVYWKKYSETGEKTQDFIPGDQCISQRFNVKGTSGKNKYYWRLCTSTSDDNSFSLGNRYVNLNDEYTFTNKVEDTSTDYDILFSNIIYTDGTDTVNMDSTGLQGSIYTSNKLYVKNAGDGIKIYKDGNYLVNGHLEWTTDIDCKLDITVFYENGESTVIKGDTYKHDYYILPEEDKNILYVYAQTSTLETWEECLWMDLSDTDKDTSSAPATDTLNSSIPEEGDVICQLGYRFTSESSDELKQRASAIIIAAYKTPDSGVKAPSYSQYMFINDYNLSNHRMTYFDAIGGHVIGEFTVQASGGQLIPLDDYIQMNTQDNPVNISVTGDYNINGLKLIIPQTDSTGKIYDLNNFPATIQIIGLYNGIPVLDQTRYRSITVNFMGETYDLLSFTPGQNDGVYISSLIPLQISGRYFNLTLGFRGQGQVITSNNITITADIYSSDHSTSYVYTYQIPVTPVTSVQGQDGEIWKLYPDTEINEVLENGKMQYLFRYSLLHIIGGSGVISAPETGMYMKLNYYNSNNILVDEYYCFDSAFTPSGGKVGGYFEFGGGNPIDWWEEDISERYAFCIAELYNSNDEILDSVQSYVNIKDTALFTVKEGLTQSIQANTQLINNETQTRQTQYSTITQRVDGINLQVQSNTQNISYLGNDITYMNSYISTIDQKADNISLRVENVNSYLNDVKDGLTYTGINISNGNINLRGDKVTFSDSTGTITDKIQINPATGTLIAENAYITGKIEAQEGRFGSEDNTFNMILDADNTSFMVKGAKEVKCHEEGGQTVIDYPYQKWSDTTYMNFKFLETTLNRWGNASYDAGSTTGRIALNPTIILRIPFAGYDTSTDDMYIQMEISPNEGIVFKQKINGVESVTGVISKGGIHINGSLGLGSAFVFMNNFANNQAARNAGLNTGDFYHTNGVLKVVI